MLGRMSIDPDVDLTAFWRQGETVMADRDGSVPRAVNFAIHNSMATQHDELSAANIGFTTSRRTAVAPTLAMTSRPSYTYNTHSKTHLTAQSFAASCEGNTETV